MDSVFNELLPKSLAEYGGQKYVDAFQSTVQCKYVIIMMFIIPPYLFRFGKHSIVLHILCFLQVEPSCVLFAEKFSRELKSNLPSFLLKKYWIINYSFLLNKNHVHDYMTQFKATSTDKLEPLLTLYPSAHFPARRYICMAAWWASASIKYRSARWKEYSSFLLPANSFVLRKKWWNANDIRKLHHNLHSLRSRWQCPRRIGVRPSGLE